jgi:DNA-binding protein HU-beta
MLTKMIRIFSLAVRLKEYFRMNKAQLIEQLSNKINLPKSQSEIVLDAALDIIQKTVSKGEEVKLVGFGTFSRLARKTRQGRNPKTGQSVVIPGAKIPRFKPGKEFKERVK